MNTTVPEAPCPVSECRAPLYLVHTANVPIYTEDPPWPGAGSATYEPDDAVTRGWEVVCVDGHTLWTHCDQIRANNIAGLTDDDETSDYAPPFLYELFADRVLGLVAGGAS